MSDVFGYGPKNREEVMRSAKRTLKPDDKLAAILEEILRELKIMNAKLDVIFPPDDEDYCGAI